MAVRFKMIPKQNNLVSPPEVKYYPCAVSKGEEDLESLSKIIATRCTISKPDCYGVIMALSEVISEALADGKIVRLDNLGTFQIYLSGTAADSPEALGKSTIKAAKIKYRPSKQLSKKLQQLSYKRIR